MSDVVIKIENLSKQYRLGLVGTGTLSHDLRRWWYLVRGKEDPYLKISEINDRKSKSESEYVWALKDISIEVKQGEVLGIIGKNGAGKSTLLKILSKVTAPTTGSIEYKGRIGSLLEVGIGFHQELTGRENIFLNGAILGMKKAEIKKKLDEIIDFSGVERYVDTPVKRYSNGMMVRLGFAVAAHLEPEILVIDEVLAVGDAEFQKKAIGKIHDVSSNDGRTVLFVSHNLGAVRNLCKSAIIIKDGKIDYSGNSNSAVDYYLSSATMEINQNSDHIIKDNQRIKGKSLDVQIISINLDKEKGIYASNEPIKIKYRLKANKDVKGFRINATIYTIEDQPVGGFFGNELFDIRKNEIKEILVSIQNHFLTIGSYKISTSVGKGNFTNGMVDFDVVVDAVQFRIETLDVNQNIGFITWNQNWGNVLFNAKCTDFLSI
jgi:lipopolysaccharide transport system ATP-binding protein